MKRADLPTDALLRAIDEHGLGTFAHLCERYPRKIVEAAIVRDARRGLVTWGVVLQLPMITDAGRVRLQTGTGETMRTMMNEGGRPLDPPAIVKHTYGSVSVPGQTYPRSLPDDLAPWHLYVRDQGHCVAIVPAGLLAAGEHPPLALLTAAPVRSVLRAGYEMRDGWPVVDLPYDPDLGLRCPDGDEEW